MNISAVKENFGAIIDNIDLSKLKSQETCKIKELLYQYKFICFKKQSMNEQQYLEFSRSIGQPIKFVDPNYHHPDYPEIFVVSNVKKDGKKIGMDRVGYYWHTDSSFLTNPLPVTMLYAQQVPQAGGETSFIDMHDVYNNLPNQLKTEIEDKMASHEGKWRYIITEEDKNLSIQEILERDEACTPSSVHPTIIMHPITKQKILYINEGFTRRIFEIDYDKSCNILNELFDVIKNNPNKYEHKWSDGDLVMWDNRSVVHRASPASSGQPRMMFRIGVNDGVFY